MNPLVKRALTGVAVALSAAALPLMAAAPAFANGSLQGAAIIKTAGGGANLQSGNGATNWTLRLPAGASCPGDGPNDGYRWQTYMVPSSVDPATLTFDSAGPVPNGFGASFRQPLYDTTSNPVVNQVPAAASPAPGPGPIINIPDVNFQVFSPGQIPAGVYNIGIACTLGGASATQESNFWNVQMTVATGTATDGNAQVTWQNGTSPSAPTITSLTAGTNTATQGHIDVAFTNPAANPALTSCTLFVGTSAGGTQFSGAGGLSGNCTSPRTISGLSYGQQYFVRMTSTNSVGNSPVSNELSSTPVRPAVTNLTATPSPNTVTLDWDDAPLLGTDQYNIDICTQPATSPCLPASAGHASTANSATSNYTFTPAVPGQQYAFTVTYGAAGTSQGASAGAAPLSNSILVQDVSVTRPNGALVLTQVCGQYGNVPAEAASTGFPGGFAANAPAGNASGNTPSGPTLGANGTGGTDPNYPSQYPNPANPTYPTHCSLDLGTASLITSGPGAGQFFA
ncbi:MAG: hypothetical protein JOZ37_03935, partial [Actinobacteria bacterium]|nr:hypothetical protein [Actinomycetota bacterium]